MPSNRFAVEAEGGIFAGLDDVQVVFHGINKSGSWAMAKVIGEALQNAGRPEAYLCHYGSKWTMDEFRAIVESANGRSFAVAHQLYGSLKPRPRRIWITQFRHPLPRALSVYNWLRNKHVRQHGSAEGFLDFESFARKGEGKGHGQVKQFGNGYGRFQASRAKGLTAKDMYEISVDTLEGGVYAIGIAERFEESIFTFAALCGLPSVAPWATDRRNKGRPLVDEIDQRQQDIIREVYEWDFALYDYALNRFKQQVDGIRFGPSLKAYEAACEGQYKDRIVA